MLAAQGGKELGRTGSLSVRQLELEASSQPLMGGLLYGRAVPPSFEMLTLLTNSSSEDT